VRARWWERGGRERRICRRERARERRYKGRRGVLREGQEERGREGGRDKWKRERKRFGVG
jgi:hypothetical protein